MHRNVHTLARFLQHCPKWPRRSSLNHHEMDFVLSQTFPASHVESSLITPVGVSYREHWADESVLSLDFQILAKHFGLFYKSFQHYYRSEFS